MATNPATGTVQARTNAFIVLAPGLHYQRDGQWFESRDEIEIINGGAVARHGAHRVTFAANINSAGAIQLVTPDGTPLKSHVLGIAYCDAASGKSVLIAGIKDSLGQLRQNQVTYPEAFDGPFRADVQYTYSRGGLEQDIVLVEQPPAPEEFGLNPTTTRLEVWTEFIQTRTPQRSTRPLKAHPSLANPGAATDPEFSDDTLTFGTMMIGTGVAFPFPGDVEEFPAKQSSTAVGKEWLTIDGRTFLVEKVDYSDIEADLHQLPKTSLAKLSRPSSVRKERSIVLANVKAPMTRTATNRRGQIEMASRAAPTKGYVLDYSIVSTLPNYVFRGDTTYMVVGNCVLNGTTVIEGGTVVKFANGSNDRLFVTGKLECQTSAYRPAYFLVASDGSVGEPIPNNLSAGGSGAAYGGRGLEVEWPGSMVDLRHLRFRNLKRPLAIGRATAMQLSHSQIKSCGSGIQNLSSSSTVWLRNVLMSDISGAGFSLAEGSRMRGEHLTLHRLGNFRDSSYGSSMASLDLVNSLLVAVTNAVAPPYHAWRKVFIEAREAGVFASAGCGHHYLATDSPFRGVGDSNIDPNLRRELRGTTTQAPVILSGFIRQDTVLRAVSPRNGVAIPLPDIGYSYDAMDYLARGLTVEAGAAGPVTLLVTNGAVVGLETDGREAGINFGVRSSFISIGHPGNLNRIVPLQTIQEGEVPGAGIYFTQVEGAGLGDYPQAFLRGTELAVPAGRMRHFANWGGSFARLSFQDCRFAGGEMYLSPDNPTHVIGVTNSLFERVKFTFHPYARAAFHAHNNLFKNGLFTIDMDPPNLPGAAAWSIRDNLFDDARLSQFADLAPGAASHNAYVLTPENQSRLRPPDPGNTDRVLSSSPSYESYEDQRYYLPVRDAELTDKGSHLAAAAGLYHYTTRISQLKESSSRVDIGLHYVARTGDGLTDSDRDGLSDFVEDSNGDGVTGNGETRWDRYESHYRLSGQPGLSLFTPVK